jgi:hypothetical protein
MAEGANHVINFILCWGMKIQSITLLREHIEHKFQSMAEGANHIINFNLCWGMNIQNNNVTPATS